MDLANFSRSLSHMVSNELYLDCTLNCIDEKIGGPNKDCVKNCVGR